MTTTTTTTTSIGNINLNGSTGSPPSAVLGLNLFGFSPLGRGLKGFLPQAYQTVDQTYEEMEHNRFQLVQAWNTSYKSQLDESKLHRIVTPFRAVTNSGDVLCRKNYSCGGPCQTFQSRPNIRGLKHAFGSIQNHCDNTTVPASACNGKYVYDSSNYMTYLKQKAIVKNYNDLSFGGNNSSGAQQAWRAVRRY